MSDEKTKRTPGPWRAWNPIQEGWAVSEVLAGRPAISMGHRVADEIDREEDARLIAAAPELLEVLKSHQAWFHSEVCSEGCSRRCVESRALIAKAEGKS